MNLEMLIKEASLSRDVVASSENYPSGSHVSLLFSDGELCFTKAGPLLHHRTLHCQIRGDATKRVSDEWFPYRMSGYGYIYCDHDKGLELSKLILGE
jgi:hypothetical protein